VLRECRPFGGASP